MNLYVVSFEKIDEDKYSFVTKGIVTDYISLQWVDKYYEEGNFNLVIPASEENMDLFKEGLFLLCGKSDRCMMIESIVFNNNLKSDGYIMQVNGRSLESILERRVAFPGQGLSTNEFKGTNGLIKAIYELIDGFFIHPEKVAMESSDGQKFFYYPERKIEFLTIPNEEDRYYNEDNPNENILRPFNESINKTVAKDNLLKIVSELCKNSYLGFRIRPYEEDGGIKWRFSLYTGKDKSYTRKNKNDPLLLFSPTLKNVESVSTTKDTTNYRNVIFCGVEKDSDGYIDFTKTGNEANGFNQKTGIDVVDKINSGATSLITGVKDRFVTMLEDSPLCYTGIFILAMAATRKDKDYTATVTKIENANERRSEIYIEKDSYDYLTENKIVTEDGIFYFKGKFKKDAEDCVITAKIDKDDSVIIGDRTYCKLILPMLSEDKSIIGFYVYTGTVASSGYHQAFFDNSGTPTAKINISKDDKISIYGEGDHSSWNGSNPGLALCDFAGNFLSTSDANYSRWIPESGFANHFYTIDCRVVYKEGSGVALDVYPTKYISKANADNIKITYRMAFGEGEGSSNKTNSFILSNVDDFKESTAVGWLTVPILKQAINDLNNINFNVLERSGIQGWFKTLDKYTDNRNQKRWLCQTYEYDTDNKGLNRKEVFVEEDNSDSDEWNASAINSFQSSTATISIDDEEDEESDEKINERLMESARKQSGNYRKKRDIDVSLELESFKYLSNEVNGYNLGDIIQVDDGWGNQDQYIITGVTITNDTSSGFKTVPTFERFEMIPKQYRQLDFLQIANMILPAKFNRHFTGEQNAKDINLPSNVYFGSKKIDGVPEDNPKIANIKDIKNETVGVITDIECDLAYVQKEVTSGEPEPLSDCFALISAIGSQGRSLTIDPNTGNYTPYDEINVPFALVTHEYNGPYHFMTDMPAGSKASNRQINMYIGIQVSKKDGIKYENGDGYNRGFLIDHINLGYKYIKLKCDNYDGYWRVDTGGDASNTIHFKPNTDIASYLYLNNYDGSLKHFDINKINIFRPETQISTQRIPSNSNPNPPKYLINIFYINNSGEHPIYNFGDTHGVIDPIMDEWKYWVNIHDIDLLDRTIIVKILEYNQDLTYSQINSYEYLDDSDWNIYIKYNNEYILLTSENTDDSYIGWVGWMNGSYVNKFYIYFIPKSNAPSGTPPEGFYDEYIFEGLSDLQTREVEHSIRISNMRKDEDLSRVVADIEIKPESESSYTDDCLFLDYFYTYDYSSGGQLTSVEFNNNYTINKDIYYTTTTIGSNTLIHKKPLTNNFYNDKIKRAFSGLNFSTYLINEFCPFSLYTNPSNIITGTILDGQRNSANLLTGWLGNRNEYKPQIGSRQDVLIDKTSWGQDNYRMPKYIPESETVEEPYSLAYNDLLYENHIVLGGCGFYRYDDSTPVKNYLLKFYDSTVVVDGNQLAPGKDPLANIAPRACDTNNGVRIYNTIKIYETVCSTRQIWFGNPNSNSICAYKNDVGTSVLNPTEDIKAYYPDLSTRKLVHEYVPVRYIEGGNDILKEEEYGLYDLIDKVFVPINWGGNDAATFIQAGGEINNE